MSSHDICISGVVYSDFRVSVSHHDGHVLSRIHLNNQSQPLIELIFIVFIFLIGGWIALHNIHCDSLVPCFEWWFDDPESMRFTSYKCFFEQCNFLCVRGALSSSSPEYNSTSSKSYLFCSRLFKWDRFLPITTKMYPLISVAIWIVVPVFHILLKFHVTILINSLVVRWLIEIVTSNGYRL